MSALNLYRGIDSASVKPLATDEARPFTSITLMTDGMDIAWMLEPQHHAAFAQRLRDIADAVESGQSVTLDKGYRGADGKWVAMSTPVIVNGKSFTPGYTVRAAAYEAMR